MNLSDDSSVNDKDVISRTCPVCHKIYSGKSQLYRHLREIHNEYGKYYDKMDCKSRHTFKCLEGCDISFRINRGLREHLNNCHEFNIKERIKEFKSAEEFKKWFAELQETGASFIKNQGSGMKKCQNGPVVTYFACNRSGIQRNKILVRKRKEKKYGSRKINAGCTSFLKLTEFEGKCVVTYCDFHYGHKIELEHLPLPFKARAQIFNKLQNGAQIVKIKLRDGENYIGLDNLERSRILTSSDLKNLRYYSRKKLKIAPSKAIRNINEMKTEQTHILTENDRLEVITISSNDYNLSEKHGEQLKLLSGSKIRTANILPGRSSEVKAGAQTQANVAKEIEAVIGNDNNVEYFEENEEVTYGRYVAETLLKIQPHQRETAKNQIDNILTWFLNKYNNNYNIMN